MAPKEWKEKGAEKEEAAEATEPKEEGAENAKEGKGKGKGKREATAKKPALTKARALAQITALDGEDDEREACSKKISWILRKGASRVNIPMDNAGWSKVADILACDLLEDMTDRSEAKIMGIIEESNSQKKRYEIKDTDNGKLIRALKKDERKSRSGAEPGEKPDAPKAANTGALQVDAKSGLRVEATPFSPQGVAGAAASMQAAYPGYGFGYPGFGSPQAAQQAAYYAAAMQAYGYPGYAGYPAAAAAAPAAAAAASGNKRFQGRVKSFNTEKGYGFIESGESYAAHGRDVFLHKAHLGDFAVNAFVSFTVEINKQGMPQARDLAASDGAGVKGKGKGKGNGKGKKEKGEGKGEKKKGGDKKDKGDKDKDNAEDKAEDKGDKNEAEEKPKTEGAAAEPAKDAAPAAEADKS